MGIHTGQILHQRYEVTEQLGRGMAKTFAGLRLANNAQVVIKELKFSELDNWKAYDLFQREIKTLESLEHPAFPELLDHFEIKEGTDTWMYLVLERLPGENLQDAMEKGWRPDQQEVKRLAQKALEALSYLHHLSPPVVHRDIKPSNLIWHNQTLYLIDFGAVQDILRPEGSSTIVGTFGYMAPEQFSGRAVPASDLYALGATLVHLLSGRAPGDIPQRELRLDFRDYVSCSESFCLWLEYMLEPMVEKRISTAVEALTLLRTPPEIKAIAETDISVVPVPITPPENTLIQLSKGSKYLSIDIPRPIATENFPAILFGYSLLCLVSFLFSANFLGFFLLFTAPAFLWLGYPFFQEYALEFNQKEVLIHSKSLFNRKKTLQLDQIESLEAESNQWRGHIILKTPQQRIKVGSLLEVREKAWLKKEITEHIERIT